MKETTLTFRRAAATAALLLVVFVTFTGSQCGRTDLGGGFGFRMPAIPESEILTYQVTAGGSPIGTYRVIARKGYFKDVPAFMLDLVTRTKTGSVETIDSSVVFVSQDTIAPLSSFRFVKTGAALVTSAANYGEGSVAVTTYTGEQEQQKLLPSEPRTYDVDQLTFLGRIVRLDPKKPAKFNVVNPMGPPAGGGVMAAEFQSGGDEMVTVPTGSFDCRRVLLKVGDNQVELWYEKAPAQRLIRYRAGEAGIVMELLAASVAEMPGVPVPDRDTSGVPE